MLDYRGMIWFDNDPHNSLGDSLKLVVPYYINKYERVPKFCILPESRDIGDEEMEALDEHGLELVYSRYLFGRHIFLAELRQKD